MHGLPRVPRRARVDFTFENHGSICLLTPVTRAAKQWAEEKIISGNDEVMFWGKSIVVEPRYAQPILDGITVDGLEWR